ncbi:hypothetical protein [Actinomadura sp. WMMA1423]|uniref:hypothetical protein n=1 Tax=Actinomadura sp. WMMA1423 TaxID=2591108 RepID=UPI001146386F|nr:hypothetical protein [Actinomadura sp. WMMA1423]
MSDHPPEAARLNEADQIAVIRPGQTLVIRYARRMLSDYEVDQLKTKLAERMPGVNLVVLGPDIEPVAVYDPNPDQD